MNTIDRSVVRRYKLGEEPSWVDEYQRYSIDERLEVRLPLISVEDLLVNKRAAGRHKDLADVEEFERSEKFRK